MKVRNLAGVLAVGVVAAVSLGLSPQAKIAAQPDAVKAETLNIDPVHSSIIFKIRHMGASNFYGRFNDASGSFTIDSANPANSKFDVTVKTGSVDTNNQERDDHLKSPDFFNAAEFPTITFKSSKVAKSSGDKLSVSGDLTVHGVTKPITVELTHTPGKKTLMGHRGGFEAKFTIKRTDFGMDTYVANGGLGEDVELIVSVEGVKP
jgi:polyisoprenoid-binding protein YceI